MKKTLLLCILILVPAIGLLAQKPVKGGRKAQIARLQATTDSLQCHIDSLLALNDSLSRHNAALIEEQKESRRVIDSLSTSLNINPGLIQALVDREGEEDLPMAEGYTDDSLEVRYFTTSVPDSVLIARLESLNSTIDIPYNSRVRSAMVMYSERSHGQLSRLLGDATFFFPIFEKALAEYDVPLEIKYLSIIESALKTRAMSRAGARGLWQFMPATGRSYGLEVNSQVDERLDIYKAVDAAARYLRDAYAAFGDWSLAISSYNCGAVNVSRAISRAKSAEFWKVYPYLPRETRGYLPLMIGAMYAMEFADQYGIEPSEPFIQEPVYDIPVSAKLHFRQISSVVGVPMNVVDYLNPQFTRQVIPGDKREYTLRLPRTWAIRYEEVGQDSIAAYRSDAVFRSKVVTPSSVASAPRTSSSASSPQAPVGNGPIYVVKRGDSLSIIAQMYGVSVQALRDTNRLTSDIILPGQEIRIPGR